MGRRSRKRAAEGTTRAERDDARRVRAAAAPGRGPRPRPGRPGIDERPPAPWGNFPLSELLVLLGILLVLWGLFSGKGGEERLAAGIVIAALGGAELALREHLAGYRSHTTLLAGVAAFAVVTAVALGLGPVRLWLLVVIAAAVFASAFYWLRELFKRRSGGLGFR
ncbi:MAG TPA: hypothetical protein VKB17_10880 [Thermoleophilaceae bacterium]|nr:hypothetical protein [Thermoleophilaceae bacterium]